MACNNFTPKLGIPATLIQQHLSRDIKSMWNTIECKRDGFSGALGGARKTHWERVSHALKVPAVTRLPSFTLLSHNWLKNRSAEENGGIGIRDLVQRITSHQAGIITEIQNSQMNIVGVLRGSRLSSSLLLVYIAHLVVFVLVNIRTKLSIV